MADYIDRVAAIDAIINLQTYKLFEGDDMLLVDIAETQTELTRLPSADVQPVMHARWEIGTGFRWRCSKCGGLTYIPSKFCSNCGARMDGEQDG